MKGEGKFNAEQQQPGVEQKMTPRPSPEKKEQHGSGKLQDKGAIVTGGDSGIGRAVAIAFAREGADVAVAYLDEHEDAQETARWVDDAGQKSLLFSPLVCAKESD